ncbi:unnamed protein product, partial [Meganyctiphanes norvegica]
MRAESSTQQDATEAISSLQVIFPDVNGEVLQYWLDAADGDIEAATSLILDNQTQQPSSNLGAQAAASQVNLFKTDKKNDIILCSCCGDTVTGFIYKCLACNDLYICGKCEDTIHHFQHPVLRIPRHKTKFAAVNRIKIHCEEISSEGYDPTFVHANVYCDGCGINDVLGYLYKCLDCQDYDLCHSCEHTQKHSYHFMLRVPSTNSQS